MIGLTSEITDEVSFGWQAQHLHLCPQMKQVWSSALLRGTSRGSKPAKDDMILFAESEEKLKDMLEDLNNESKRDGMKLHKKKTKIMCNEVARNRLRTGAMIDREQLEEVTEYNYLGGLVASHNEMSKGIGQRITSGWRRFGEYSHFLKDWSLFAWREKS